MSLHTLNKDCKAITIWQQNLNKSPSCQHSLISSSRLVKHNIDIIALQEPSINFLKKTIALQDWIPIYPMTHDKQPNKTRAVMLIRGDILTENWEQIDFPSSDVTAICIREKWGTLHIFNIYNDCEHNDTLNVLMEYHRKHEQDIAGTEDTHQEHHLLWLGDFNWHHPYWDNLKDNRLFTHEACSMAEVLLRKVADLGMDLALPKGILTHRHHVTKKWTHLDQVFAMEHTMEAITTCNTLQDEQGVNTDHVLVVTVMDMELTKAPMQTARNFRDVDWSKFQKTLEGKLNKLQMPAVTSW